MSEHIGYQIARLQARPELRRLERRLAESERVRRQLAEAMRYAVLLLSQANPTADTLGQHFTRARQELQEALDASDALDKEEKPDA